ncbi:hypothetical protein H8B02_11700 [Bradyrhizobium sp. Pear77]|uniref:terminase small subunit-like protein n=1 Tax=Bradyrhizobium altum TaxID=1571202 RepID=UPI001E34935E|nr:hypothetical protein [Bradyrhizobium altum]MCC8954100.1 hypothetical protein [Bradyrhizobium altum]
MGRPSTFTGEIFEAICERLADGQTLKQICRDPEMPDRYTVLRWIKNDDGRRRLYDQARRDGTDSLADDLIDIAWDTSNDSVVNERGTVVCNHEWIARSRVKTENIRFLIMKLNPRRYGDKLPEAIEARQMEIDTQAQLAEQNKITQVTRIILRPGDTDLDENGNPYPNGRTSLLRRIAELEAELAGRNPAPKPPALLTHDPGPLPSRMDQDIARRMVRLIKDYVRKDDQRPPETVLDEVLSVCRNALLQVYGPSGELIDFGAAAQ